MLNKRYSNKLFFHELNHNAPETPLLPDINRSINTFKFYFKGIKDEMKNLEQMGRYCRWISRGSLSHLNKKLFYSSLSMENDPFMDYLTKLKGK